VGVQPGIGSAKDPRDGLGQLVLYYDDAAPYWDGIVRIGEVEADLSAIRQLPQAARVTIEPAG
jgi:hypothetical protein